MEERREEEAALTVSKSCHPEVRAARRLLLVQTEGCYLKSLVEEGETQRNNAVKILHFLRQC